MGKLTAAQCNSVHQDQIWKDYVRKEQVKSENWKQDWGCLLDKYRELERNQEERAGGTRKSESLKLPPLQVPRQDTSRPFPKITSHEVGWRSGKGYLLEVYGRWGRPRYSIVHQLK